MRPQITTSFADSPLITFEKSMNNLGKCRNWSSRHFLWRILNSSNRASATFKHLASEICQIKCHQELLLVGVILEVLWHWQRQGYDVLQLFLDLPNQGLSRTSGDRQSVQPIKLNIAKGTTDPRVEFCLPKFKQVQAQISIKFHLQNLDQARTSKSQPNISI